MIYVVPKSGLDILCCGAGQQSTALALMSCDKLRRNAAYPQVPVYDAVIFSDTACEAPWVYRQVHFIADACKRYGIPFYIVETHLYDDYIKYFGVKKSLSSIPFWSVGEDGKKAKMRRHCTIDYKILAIQKLVRYSLLGYEYGERTRRQDIGAHRMHIGFSYEEQSRVFASRHELFTNCYPLVDMHLTRRDNYSYTLEQWGLDTKASSCAICPFHRNQYFMYLRNHHPDLYDRVVRLDDLLEEKQPQSPIRSKLFISRARMRIKSLPEDLCHDGEYFPYKGEMVWNGF